MSTLGMLVVRLFKWTVLIGVGALLLLGFGLTWPLEVFVFLCTGWARFLSRVLPQVDVNGLAVAETAVVAAVLAGGLHRFLGWLWRRWHAETPEARPWPVRWTVSLVTLLVLLFGATMATVGIGHQVGWMVTSPEPLVRSSFFSFSAEELAGQPLASDLCQSLRRLAQGDVTDTQVLQALLRERGMPERLERMAVVPWTDAAGTRGFWIFPRDPLVRERAGAVRCPRTGVDEYLPAAELARLLEATQAGEGGASASPM